MSVETKQTTLDDQTDRDTEGETLVEGEVYHRPVADPELAGDDVTAMPACNPSKDADFVKANPETLSDEERCNSPRCFGGGD